MSGTELIPEDGFLTYAKKIIGRNKSALSEEECRTAISRAYYSLFHVTGSVLRRKYSFELIKQIRRSYPGRRIDLPRLNRLEREYLRTFNLHQIYFLTLHDLGFRDIAFEFKGFRAKRNDADYDLSLNIRAGDTEVIVNEVEKVQAKVRRL